MKKLRINVNGKIYDVLVEVLEDDEQYPSPDAALPFPPPPVAGRTQLPPASPAAPATVAPPPGIPAGVDPDAVRAPIAGTVQKVFVSAGQAVEEKTPVVLLDAMKMDTYIYAPRSGKVAEVHVKAGETVQVGETLISFVKNGG